VTRATEKLQKANFGISFKSFIKNQNQFEILKNFLNKKIGCSGNNKRMGKKIQNHYTVTTEKRY
jgi:hypothetical protein